MKKINTVLLLLLFYTVAGFSQVASLSLGIDGLHCSACSFGTEKAIRQLDFVDDVKMDLNKHIAEITFKQGKAVDFNAVAKKVVDAGFSVRSAYVIYDFNNLNISNNSCFDGKDMVFSFIGIKDPQVLNGKHAVHLIGNDFMSRSEYKKWKLLINHGCDVPGSMKKAYQVSL